MQYPRLLARDVTHKTHGPLLVHQDPHAGHVVLNISGFFFCFFFEGHMNQ